MSVGGRIKALRKVVNITQEEFAGRLCISKGFLSNLEKGVRQPSDQLVRLISYEYSSSENWLNTGEGEMFISLEEIIRKQIARSGERAYSDALQRLMNDHGLVVLGTALGNRPGSKYPELDNMIRFLNDLWSLGDENLKAWALIQFTRAFPPDIEDEVLKKLTEKQGQVSIG